MSEGIGMQQGLVSGGLNIGQQERHFYNELQTVSNKIHATNNIDEIMLDLSKDICALFSCERMTMYLVSENRTSIESKVKTGLHGFKDFRLPISQGSIAGYVALSKKMINVRNVYDDAELLTHSPRLRFMRYVDERTSYRTKTMLAHPIVSPSSGELLGVLQLLNRLDGEPFPFIAEEGIKDFCVTLGVAFAQRMAAPLVAREKYDCLVVDGVLSTPELALAKRAARRKEIEVEDVLVNEFQVKVSEVGASLAQFYGVPYEPFDALRVAPLELLKNFKRTYVEDNQWVVLGQEGDTVRVLTTDPYRVSGSRVINNLFPKMEIVMHVTTIREFMRTVDLFFGEAVTIVAPADSGEAPLAPVAIKEGLRKLLDKAIADVLKQSDLDVQVIVVKDEGSGLVWMGEDESADKVSGQFIIDYRINLPARHTN